MVFLRALSITLSKIVQIRIISLVGESHLIFPSDANEGVGIKQKGGWKLSGRGQNYPYRKNKSGKFGGTVLKEIAPLRRINKHNFQNNLNSKRGSKTSPPELPLLES